MRPCRPSGAERPLSRAGSQHHRPGRQAGAASRSPPTWLAAAPTFSSAATSNTSLRDWIAEERAAGREPTRPPSPSGRPRSRTPSASRRRSALESGGLLRDRHRAPREPAHRQPAARPLRPPGRPGPLQVLSRARRRPDAHLRRRAHGQRAARRSACKEGEAITHPWMNKSAREGAEEGRGAQLRHPQADPEVRRRDERPAQGHLRAAHGHHGRGGRLARRSSSFAIRSIDDLVTRFIPERAYAEQWDTAGLRGGHPGVSSTSSCRSRTGRRGRHRRPGDHRAHLGRRGRARRPPRPRQIGPGHLSPDREDGAAADAGSPLARASRHARAFASGHRLPRLWPARSAERVQEPRPSFCSRVAARRRLRESDHRPA